MDNQKEARRLMKQETGKIVFSLHEIRNTCLKTSAFVISHRYDTSSEAPCIYAQIVLFHWIACSLMHKSNVGYRGENTQLYPTVVSLSLSC